MFVAVDTEFTECLLWPCFSEVFSLPMWGAEFDHLLKIVYPCKVQTWEQGRFLAFHKMLLPTGRSAIFSKPVIPFHCFYYYGTVSSFPIPLRCNWKIVCASALAIDQEVLSYVNVMKYFSKDSAHIQHLAELLVFFWGWGHLRPTFLKMSSTHSINYY